VTDTSWDRLASAVRDRRKHLGWSQAAVSRAGGPSDQTVAKIETGKDGPFRANTLAQLDQGLGWIPGTAERIVNGNAGDPDKWVAQPQGRGVLDHAGASDSVARHPGVKGDQFLSKVDRYDTAGETMKLYNLVNDRHGSEPEAQTVLKALWDFMAYLHEKRD
jgi:hypothetical protein